MARAAAALDPAARSTPAAFGSDRRARLPSGSRVAILDDTGNRLLELDVAEAAAASAAPTSPTGPPPAPATDATDHPPWTRNWLTWAIPTGAFGLVAAGFGIATLASYQRADMITSDSGKYHLVDAEDNLRRGRTFVWVTVGAGALTIAFGIPTAIFYLRQRHQLPALLVPTAGDGHVGAAVVGRF
jgi:hypothetical protein